ncbi:PPC domain-containing DNA-binding protein [Azospirillum sp. ST 5-10]|uniref:PPC domain-containing DNA-binding protein n=1 Tax=unclassified Azospirillum TaxID=2630922 RepID=UPI003F4A69BB
MKVTVLQDANPRTYAVVFGEGDDPMAGLKDFARAHGVTAAGLTAVGAFSRAVLGFFDMAAKDYVRIPVEEQAEVAALVGNLTCFEGRPKLHLHLVLGLRDGRAVAGHLLEAAVRPTLEVMVTETPAHLVRETDPDTGLSLLARRG